MGFVGLLARWAKVWTPPTGLNLEIATPVAFLAVLWCFHFGSKQPQENTEKLMKAVLLVVVVSSILAGILQTRFTREVPTQNAVIVIGCSLRPDVRLLLENSETTAEDLLPDAGYDAEKIWTANSITFIKMTLSISWIIVCTSFSMVVMLFTVLHPVPRAARAKKSRSKQKSSSVDYTE